MLILIPQRTQVNLETGRQVFVLEQVALLFDVRIGKDICGTRVPKTRKGPNQLDPKVPLRRAANISFFEMSKFFLGRL